MSDNDKSVTQRWMLKFGVIITGTNCSTEAVLKRIIYKEETNLAIKTIHRPDVDPLVLLTVISDQAPPSPANQQPSPISGSLMASGPKNSSKKEFAKVVQFNGNGFRSNMILGEVGKEPKKATHSDLRFRATIRSKKSERTTKSPFYDASLKKNSGTHDGWSRDIDINDLNKFAEVEDLKGFEYILPIFYIQQPVGYLLVAELIEKFIEDGKESIYRRLMLLINQRVQRLIFTPSYKIADEDQLYTIGFHQDSDHVQGQGRVRKAPAGGGDNPRLEFLLGQDENYAHFATFELSLDDFEFKINDSAEIGIGCWPGSLGVELYYQGAIKEIICDPHGECTVC